YLRLQLLKPLLPFVAEFLETVGYRIDMHWRGDLRRPKTSELHHPRVGRGRSQGGYPRLSPPAVLRQAHPPLVSCWEFYFDFVGTHYLPPDCIFTTVETSPQLTRPLHRLGEAIGSNRLHVL